MDEYRSPFQIPDTACTAPGDHDKHPGAHAKAGTEYASNVWGKACPVHCKDKTLIHGEWIAWAIYREAFATTDGEENEEARQLFMDKMLGTVTETNPADAPPDPDYGIGKIYFDEKPKTKVKTWHDIDGRPHRLTREIRAVSSANKTYLIALFVWIALFSVGMILTF